MKLLFVNQNYMFACCILISILSCSRKIDYNDVNSGDKSKPAAVTNVTVENAPGGATLRYTLPASSNILYVLAEYNINGSTKLQKKNSYLLDSMFVDGFQKSQDYKVLLTVVSKAEVKSDPVEITVHPDQPPYLLAAGKLNIAPDFGGPRITSVNTPQKNIRYVVLGVNPVTKVFSPVYQAYTSDSLIGYTVRGFSDVEQQFGVYFTDQYGNSSDTTFATLKPFPESMINKSKFLRYPLPSDAPFYDWGTTRLWDGVSSINATTTNQASYMLYARTNVVPAFPIIFTFDMGTKARLSRFVYWQRCMKDGQYAWNSYSPKNFTLWGSAVTNPRDAILPVQSAQGDVVGDWKNIGNFTAPEKPSGLPPGQVNAADIAFSLEGFEMFFTPSTEPVRYIRIQSKDNYANFAGIIIEEMSMYGNPE